MSWRPAKALMTLLAQIDAAAPKRSKVSDGRIGNAEHALRASDHNPNSRGVVTAMDVTHDPKHGCNAEIITEGLRLSQNGRIKYVIWNRRVFSATVKPWKWRAYTGKNPHTVHFHISVVDDVADDFPWTIQ